MEMRGQNGGTGPTIEEAVSLKQFEVLHEAEALPTPPAGTKHVSALQKTLSFGWKRTAILAVPE